MYKLANGWTKEKVMTQVKKYNNGTKAIRVDPPHYCSYKNENGNRCAIGCFIPDGHFGLEFEGSVEGLLSACSDLINKMPFKNIEALISFQTVHDISSESGSIYEAINKFLTTECEE